MPLTRFRTALFIPVFYIAAILTFMLISFNADAPGRYVTLIALAIAPVHLLSMASIFYCLYFTAKSLRAAELQRPVVLSDYLGELFMMWFFPVGIWVIQPRVNALFGTTPLATSHSHDGNAMFGA